MPLAVSIDRGGIKSIVLVGAVTTYRVSLSVSLSTCVECRRGHIHTVINRSVLNDHVLTGYSVGAENTGKTVEEIARDTDRDNFMTAQQALEYGLIDKVLTKRI